MPPPSSLPPRRALARCLCVALTALVCAGLIGAAALVPAPPGALAVIVVVGIAVPMVAAWDLPAAVAALRQRTQAVSTLRRQLAQLPEVKHPRGY
jgi:arginine exporter protein ArgO